MASSCAARAVGALSQAHCPLTTLASDLDIDRQGSFLGSGWGQLSPYLCCYSLLSSQGIKTQETQLCWGQHPSTFEAWTMGQGSAPCGDTAQGDPAKEASLVVSAAALGSGQCGHHILVRLHCLLPAQTLAVSRPRPPTHSPYFDFFFFFSLAGLSRISTVFWKHKSVPLMSSFNILSCLQVTRAKAIN